MKKIILAAALSSVLCASAFATGHVSDTVVMHKTTLTQDSSAIDHADAANKVVAKHAAIVKKAVDDQHAAVAKHAAIVKKAVADQKTAVEKHAAIVKKAVADQHAAVVKHVEAVKAAPAAKPKAKKSGWFSWL